MNWLCWHIGTVTDPKFGRIAQICKTSRATVIAVWAVILEGAKDGRGAYSFDAEDTAFSLDIDPILTDQIHKVMISRGLVDGENVLKWQSRQHGTSTERVRKHRKRKSVSVTDETFRNVTETTQTDKDISLTEINTETPASDSGSRSKRETAVALSIDWKASEEQISFAGKMGLVNGSIEREVIKFRAYWTNGKGSGTRRTVKGWNQTWMNWIEKASKEPANTRAVSIPQPSTSLRSDAIIQWRSRFSGFKRSGYWLPQWGPKPGQEKCQCPPEVMKDE